MGTQHQTCVNPAREILTAVTHCQMRFTKKLNAFWIQRSWKPCSKRLEDFGEIDRN